MKHNLPVTTSALAMLILSAKADDKTPVPFHPSISIAVGQAHNVLWSKSVDKHGVVLDCAADLPTTEECAHA